MIKGGMVSMWHKWNYFRKQLMMMAVVLVLLRCWWCWLLVQVTCAGCWCSGAAAAVHATINLMQRRTRRGCGEAVIKGGNGQLLAKVELL